MAKIADKYFKVNPWKIIEEGFDKEHNQAAESIFSLGNEYMGVRGYFEEGYSGKGLTGSYFNGIYAGAKLGEDGYKGVVNETEFMVNAVNWLSTRITIDSENLDLYVSSIEDYKRVLDMQNGLLTRSFVWTTKSGKKTKAVFERFLSMNQVHIGVQRIRLTPLNYSGNIEIKMEADFGILHQMHKKNYWKVLHKNAEPDFFEIAAETVGTHKYLYSGSRIWCDGSYTVSDQEEEKKIGKQLIIAAKEKEAVSVIRITWNDEKKDAEGNRKHIENAEYEELLNETADWWKNVWEHSDIVIDGDDENQQGIRFCIFQMMQTYHGANPGNNIGAKGLTGEAYNGNAFWDTETYCLPFFVFNNLEAARNLLMFRYRTLEEAKKRAADLDCRGAFYPIATISGKECCNLWQHASLQLQASTAVAYGIWFYEKMSNDKAFLKEYGAEMLVEISRMLATRGDWSADGKYYGYYCVMGPDEFQMMVNHNCYTNFMGKFTMKYTIDTLEELCKEDAQAYKELVNKLSIDESEIADWHTKAEHMLIPRDDEHKLYEQHDGFFKLPHVDVDKIPVEEFPLYHHWSYDRIYRNDMIKQPDVLMFMLMFNHMFSEEELKVNYEYYEPRCIHESSLSPSVHSILASQLKKKEEAYSFFRFATRMDLDNYNRNGDEGLHTTSIAAAWMNIIYGFGGMRSDGDILELSPTIPQGWKGYQFRITCRNCVLKVQVEKDCVKAGLLEGSRLELKIYGKDYALTQQTETIEIPKEWK
ncbi:MAG: family 65 glycosyl hydrolase [Lachnospiraceae bacterium]|nr:family 65 glycosyl hydrolase [Lachnospiraceae bacterium]